MGYPLLLVVEDERLLHLFLEDVLEGAGFAVLLSENGDDGIAELDSDIGRFSGLITDIKLGSKANGWAVAQHARQLNPALPVVYMTGDSSHEWAAQGVPGSVVLTKPFAEAQLVTAISQLLIAVPLA